MKFEFYRKLSEHKNIELELELGAEEHSIFYLFTDARRKGDHPGFKFRLELFNLFILDFNFYDNRHWNWDANRFYEPGEEGREWEESNAKKP